MARDDFYNSLFGKAYSAYMERPRLSRSISKLAWGGDTKPYYESMIAVGEVADGDTGDFGQVATQEELETWLGDAHFELSAQKRSGPFWFFEARLVGAAE